MLTASAPCRTAPIDVDTLEDRLRHEIVSQHGVQPLAPVYGAATRVA